MSTDVTVLFHVQIPRAIKKNKNEYVMSCLRGALGVRLGDSDEEQFTFGKSVIIVSVDDEISDYSDYITSTEDQIKVELLFDYRDVGTLFYILSVCSAVNLEIGAKVFLFVNSSLIFEANEVTELWELAPKLYDSCEHL